MAATVPTVYTDVTTRRNARSVPTTGHRQMDVVIINDPMSE